MELSKTTTQRGEHHIAIPNHPSLRIGTVAAILSDVARHLEMPKEELNSSLFGK